MISLEKLYIMNKVLIDNFGGVGVGFRDKNLAISAIDSLDQEVFGRVLYPTVEDKISHLVFSIIANHIFLDGNKRTGALVLETLCADYIPLDYTDDELIELALGVAKSEINREGIKNWIIEHKVNVIRELNLF